MTNKEKYIKAFNVLQFPEEINLETESEKRYRFSMRYAVAVVAAFVVMASTVTACATEFISILSQNSSVSEYVNKYVYTDSNEHAKMTVMELLSDRRWVQVTVLYEALDEYGREWIHQFYKQGFNGFIGQLLLEEYNKDNSVCVVLYGKASEKNSAELDFHYPLPGKLDNSIQLKIPKMVEVYGYNLVGDTRVHEQYEALYAELSEISCTVYGKGYDLIERRMDEKSWGIQFLLPREGEPKVSFILEDGSTYEKKHYSYGYGVNTLLGHPSFDEEILEKYDGFDAEICSIFYTDAGEWVPETVDPQSVRSIVINGKELKLERTDRRIKD